MSLINDALKKAQKLRTGDPTAVAPMPGGGRVTKRGEPRSTQQLVLIAAGAVALVVLSVVVTFWFVNRTPEPKPAPKPVAVKTAETSGPTPTIVPPTLPSPPAAETPAPKSATPAGPTEPAPKPVTSPATNTATTTPQPATTPPATTPPPATNAGASKPETAPAETATPPAPAPAAASPAPGANAPTDPRVHAYVDSIKVMGIRSSGGDSRVLMNDRVFRVNDIVERNLGIRLTGVAHDALTFTDSNGAVYVKNF